jgi:alpha-tubulin suppressor-like RCC1 family protein
MCVPEVAALVPGRYVECWILVDDQLQCTASSNRHGQTGAGNRDAGAWVSPRDLPAVRLARAGTGQVCAVDQTEQLWCWGDNRYGFIPDQGKTVLIPTKVDSPGRVAAIALGYDRPYLLTDDHKLWVQRDSQSWRRALRGKAIVEIDAERFLVVARTERGAVWTWTHAPKKVTRVPELDDAVELAVGSEHACARDDAGAVVCWGANDWGQVGVEDPRLQPIPVAVEVPERAVQIDAFENLSCARSADLEVYCWGELFGAIQAAPQRMDLGPATAIAITGDRVCALGEDRLRRCVATTRRGAKGDINGP